MSVSEARDFLKKHKRIKKDRKERIVDIKFIGGIMFTLSVVITGLVCCVKLLILLGEGEKE